MSIFRTGIHASILNGIYSTGTREEAANTHEVSNVEELSTENQEASNTALEQSDRVLIEADAGVFPQPETVVVIKKEKLSEEITYTDVECLGEMIEDTICISDSEEADASLVKDLEQEESQNPFLQEINADTQPHEEEIEVTAQQRSDETMQMLRNFEPVSVQQALHDKVLKERAANSAASTSTGTKRKVFNRPCPKSKRKFRTNELEYLDSTDDSLSSGNETNVASPGHVNDDFNVFLSSELNSEEIVSTVVQASVVPETTPITFAGQSSSSGTRDKNETTCTIVRLHHVYFAKDARFEIHLSLPQYTLHNIIIQDDNIEAMLDVDESKLKNIMNLLNILETYEYSPGIERSYKRQSALDFFKAELDRFFFTEIKFKSFSFLINGKITTAEYECVSKISYSNVDVTASIATDTLLAMKICH